MAANHRDRKVDALSPTGECGDQRFIRILGELDEIAQQRESFRVPFGNDPLEPIERFFRDALRHGNRKRSMRFGRAQVEICDDQRAAVDQECRPLGEEFHRLVRDRDVEILRHGDRGAGARRDTCGVTLTNSAS